jgi:hypothetical protein
LRLDTDAGFAATLRTVRTADGKSNQACPGKAFSTEGVVGNYAMAR